MGILLVYDVTDESSFNSNFFITYITLCLYSSFVSFLAL